MFEIAQAIRCLLSNCDGARERDGAGFNGFDAPRARQLAATYPNWKPWEATAAWSMLQKYAAQLKGFDIDIKAVPKPVVPAKPAKLPESINWLIDYTTGSKGTGFYFKTPYNASFVVAVKAALQTRSFCGETKRWYTPSSPDSANAIISLLESFRQFDLTAAATAELERVTAKAAQAIEASTRQTSDYHVDGLLLPLRPFQNAGVEAIVEHFDGVALLADDMGLGKTPQILASILQMDAVPALLIVPANLKWNWFKECKKFLGDRYSVGVIEGRKFDSKPTASQRKMKALDNTRAANCDLVIINYDIVPDGWGESKGKKRQVKLSPIMEYVKKRGIKFIGLDESHYIKNDKAQRTVGAHQMRELVENRVCASGTPINNRPVELIPQLKFLGVMDKLGGEWNFKMRYCAGQQVRKGGELHWDFTGASNLEELSQKLKAVCMIRRKKSDVLTELPSKNIIKLDIDLDNWGEYEKTEKDIASYAAQLALEHKTAFSDWLKKQGINEHMQSAETLAEMRRTFGAEKKDNAKQTEALARFNVLKQIAARGMRKALTEWLENFHEGDEKLVIFDTYIESQQYYYDLLKPSGAVRIMGDMNGAQRQQAVESFQNDPKVKDIVCSLWAAAEGITLTAASNLLDAMPGWNPGRRNQAHDRIHRISQTKQCNIYIVNVPGTIIEDLNDLIEAKEFIITSAIDGGTSDSDDANENIFAALAERLGARLKAKGVK